MASSSALAYWELIPQVEAGITWEDNPRYISSSEKAAAEAAAPGISDDAAGTFLESRLDASYRTDASLVRLSPRIRSTNFLKSNQDLNDDDWTIDLVATHEERRGGVGLSTSYRETSVRTGEFESATPENPNAPPEDTGGSGRYTGDDVQKTWDIRPYIAYNLSPRNIVRLNFSAADIQYDQPVTPGSTGTPPLRGGYFDYTYQQTALEVSHYLNEKNFLQVSLNGSGFEAEQPNGPFRNSSDSFGVSASYNRVITATLSANATIGTSRTTIDVVGLPFDPLTGIPCPPDALCSASDAERNFVGDFGLRKRSELTTLNFNLSRSIAPRSDGTEVIQDSARFYVDRTLTQRLNVAVGTIYSKESGVAGLSREERTYFTIDTSLTWRLTPTLSTYGKYTYISDEDSVTNGNFKESNHRLFFGVVYRGVGVHR